mgnify:CR=1 FL=1
MSDRPTPLTDSLLNSKPAIWYDWNSADLHELEFLAKRLERDRAESTELAEAFKSYLEDDSRSERRRQACLEEVRTLLVRMREEK